MMRWQTSVFLLFFSLFYWTTIFGQEDFDREISFSELTKYIEEGDTIRAPLRMAQAYQLLAEKSIYQLNDQDAVISNYLNSIDLYWKGGDSISYFTTLIDLARYYESTGYLGEAKSIFEQMQARFIASNDTVGQMLIYSELADIELVQNNVKLALDYLDRIKTFHSQVQDSLISAITSFTLSTINKSGDNKEIITDSLEFLLDRRHDTLDRPNYLSTMLVNNGTYFQANHKFDLAVFYLTKATESAGRNADRKKEAFKALADCFQMSGNFQDAYEYLHEYTYLNDSVFNARRLELLEGLTVKNAELDQKQQSIEMERDLNIAEFKNRINNLAFYGLILGALIILIVSYLIIRNYQERLNTNQIISKQKEEITKRRITDLENNLKIETMHSMISGQEAERERIAKDLHDSLGGLLSTVKLHFDAVQTKNDDIKELNEYQQANSLLDEACKEVRNISNNMQPGALLKLGIVAATSDLVNRLQSGGKPIIDFQHFGINGHLDNTIRLNIFRIIQELLYNSIKHAHSNEILVQLIQKDNEMILMVEDDGIGFDSHEVDKGMGTENIASRVNYLKGDLSVHSVKGTGTTTMINIPLPKTATAE